VSFSLSSVYADVSYDLLHVLLGLIASHDGSIYYLTTPAGTGMMTLLLDTDRALRPKNDPRQALSNIVA
jgi:hypothetical protein